MEARRKKQLLLAALMLVLFLPFVQKYFPFVKERQLKGAYVDHPKPRIALAAWFDGSYQEGYEAWLDDDFGFRHSLVRLHNQLVYSCFNQASGFGIVAGKDGYLFEEDYIKAHLGQDFIGDAAVQNTVRKIRAIQDTLAKKNITFFVVLAPGKATYLEEKIPDAYGEARAQTNYKSFTHYFGSLGVNHIDFQKWFLQLKPHTPFPLYPKTGTHWTNYGASLAADSIIKYVEQRRHIDMPALVIDKLSWGDTLRYPENDIGQTINLICDIQPMPTAWVDEHFESSAGKTQPNMLVVSDSYFWQLYDKKIAPKSFSKIDVRYYNTTHYNSGSQTSTPIAGKTAAEEAQQHDVLMILCTEPHLNDFSWKFIDELYDVYVLKKSPKP